jgi:hypothetical protein
MFRLKGVKERNVLDFAVIRLILGVVASFFSADIIAETHEVAKLLTYSAPPLLGVAARLCFRIHAAVSNRAREQSYYAGFAISSLNRVDESGFCRYRSRGLKGCPRMTGR